MATKIEVTKLNALDDNLVEGQKVIEIVLGPTIGADTSDLSHAVEQAEAAQVAAELAEANAKASELAALASEGAAQTAQTAAETAEANAKASEAAAQSSEDDAQISEDAAAAAAVAALTSQNAAASSASDALASENAASASETSAASSASDALASENAAAISETNAASSAADALASENAAASSAADALASENAAAASETNAASSAASALASKNAAATSETNAASSASDALASENAAAASASNALTSETNAASSASDALASENAAATSETNAASSAADALTSETNAASSASDALASKNAAATSETNAASSEASASASAASALSSKNAAETAETNAASSASDALASENAAATSETNAASSASAALASQGAAAISETNAANSESAAQTAAAGAASSEAAAAQSAEDAANSATAAATALRPRGDWDASSGNFPTPTLSPDEIADFYQISVAGVMSDANPSQPDMAVEVGDQLYWHLDNDIWYAIDNTDQVISVDGMKGVVVVDKYTQAQADARFVNTTGDTMTGNLTLDTPGAGTLAVQAGANFNASLVLTEDNASHGAIFQYEGDLNQWQIVRRSSGSEALVMYGNRGSNSVYMSGDAYVNTNQRVFAEDYHPNADKWTTARTVTLTGDATGSFAIDGTSNESVAVTVVNDSHTHDGRYYTETESDARFAPKDPAGYLPLDGGHLTGEVTGQYDWVLNRTFTMIENATPQYLLLCANAASNNVNGDFILNRTSGNYQSANLSVVVTSGSSLLPFGTIVSIQSTQANEEYRLVTVDYLGNSWVAIKYTGNAYPVTDPGLFTGRIKSSLASSLTAVGAADVANEQPLQDHTKFELNGESIFHEGYHPNADKWTTARTLSLTGDATGSVSIDGSANASISVDVNEAAHAAVADRVDIITSFSGKYPMTVNVNGLLYSHTGVQYEGSSGTVFATKFDGDLIGNASTATTAETATTAASAGKWTTARTLTLNGDASGAVSIDGSSNETLTVTVANDSHTHDTQYRRFKSLTPGSNHYFRIASINGDDNHVQLIVSNTGDYGNSQLGTYLLSAGARRGAYTLRVNEWMPTVNDTPTFYYREVSENNVEIWAKCSDYNAPISAQIIGQDGASLLMDSSTAAAPSGLVAATNYSYSGIFSTRDHIVEEGTRLSSKYLGILDNAVSASKWETARTITLAGDASGSVSIDGAANKTLTVTVANDSHTHDTRYYTKTQADSEFLSSSAGISDLSDVATTSLVEGDYLSWDGSAFVNVNFGDSVGEVSAYALGTVSNATAVPNSAGVTLSVGDFVVTNFFNTDIIQHWEVVSTIPTTEFYKEIGSTGSYLKEVSNVKYFESFGAYADGATLDDDAFVFARSYSGRVEGLGDYRISQAHPLTNETKWHGNWSKISAQGTAQLFTFSSKVYFGEFELDGLSGSHTAYPTQIVSPCTDLVLGDIIYRNFAGALGVFQTYPLNIPMYGASNFRIGNVKFYNITQEDDGAVTGAGFVGGIYVVGLDSQVSNGKSYGTIGNVHGDTVKSVGSGAVQDSDLIRFYAETADTRDFDITFGDVSGRNVYKRLIKGASCGGIKFGNVSAFNPEDGVENYLMFAAVQVLSTGRNYQFGDVRSFGPSERGVQLEGSGHTIGNIYVQDCDFAIIFGGGVRDAQSCQVGNIVSRGKDNDLDGTGAYFFNGNDCQVGDVTGLFDVAVLTNSTNLGRCKVGNVSGAGYITATYGKVMIDSINTDYTPRPLSSPPIQLGEGFTLGRSRVVTDGRVTVSVIGAGVNGNLGDMEVHRVSALSGVESNHSVFTTTSASSGTLRGSLRVIVNNTIAGTPSGSSGRALIYIANLDYIDFDLLQLVETSPTRGATGFSIWVNGVDGQISRLAVKGAYSGVGTSISGQLCITKAEQLVASSTLTLATQVNLNFIERSVTASVTGANNSPTVVSSTR